MKLITYFMIFTLLAFSIGCNVSKLDDGRYAFDDAAAFVDLNLRTTESDDPWTQATKSPGLTLPQEQAIATLDILVFNAAGSLVSHTKLTNPVLTSALRVNTKSGTGMSVYAIANASSQAVGGMLNGVGSVAGLQNFKVYNLNDDIAANSTLVMQGSAVGVTLSGDPVVNTLSITLLYVAAKVRVNVVSSLPGGDVFELLDWSVKSTSSFSYLLPRAQDAVSGAADFATTAVNTSWDDKSDIVMADNSVRAGKSTVFYAFENRKGTNSNSDQKLKTGQSPANATAVVIRGNYKTSTSVQLVTATVMLGANSTNDYNVNRRNQYTYTINIKGFNDITVDTRYKNDNAGFKVDILNPTLDAHYDYRPMRIGSFAGSAIIEVLDGSGNVPPASFWLKVSAKDITKFVDNGAGTYIRPTYVASDMALSIPNVEFTNVSAMSYTTHYLYADEFLTPAATRTAKIRVTGTQSYTSTTDAITINITQKGIQTMGDVGLRTVGGNNVISSTNYVLGVENVEEASMLLTPGGANEQTSTMQWGFASTELQTGAVGAYYLRSGFDNTGTAVYNGTTLRDPYGRTGGLSGAAYNSIFNTYAARYCFEKNRDLNGDGAINGTEIKWYLPSTDELLLIYAGEPSLSQIAGEKLTATSYWSSTESTSTGGNQLNLTLGGRTESGVKTTASYVRCVRAI